jgi:hypothetical protein
MADKVTKKKRDFSKAILIAKVSMFWLVVAGVVILVQATERNAFVRGQVAGFAQATASIQAKK